MSTHRTVAAHEQEFRISYADTDAGGVAFHGSHLVWAERARMDALRTRGAAVSDLLAEHGCHFLVRRIEIDYWRPLRLEARVGLRTSCGPPKGSSCVVRHDFAVDGALAARVLATLVCVRAADGRPVRIPPRWREALAGLEEPVED